MRKPALALFALLLFGCHTLRAQAPGPGAPADVRDDVARPEVELWLESAEAVPDAEARAAMGEAQAALQRALAGREIDASALGAEDAQLFVRERAVARTASHRHDQTAAKVGLAVGFVALVVVAVVAAVSGKSSRPPPPPPPRPRAVPILPPAGARPPPPVPWRPSPAGPAFALGFELEVPLGRPLVLRPSEPAGPAAPGVAAARDPREALPPLPDLELERRGFFDGDDALIELDLVDRADGRLLWDRVVRGDADARDGEQIGALVESALADQPWARARRGGAPP